MENRKRNHFFAPRRLAIPILLLSSLLYSITSNKTSSVSIQKQILFVGDISFGESYQKKLEKKGAENILKSKGYSYSFEKLNELTNSSEIILGNLETPLSTCPKSPLSGKGKYKLHKGDTTNTPKELVSNHVKAVSLANNHAMDFGVEGLLETFNVLTRYQISYWGAGINDKTAAEPLKIFEAIGKDSLKILILAGMPYDDKYAREFNYYATTKQPGVNGWIIDVAKNQIKRAKEKHNDAFIIVYPHWFENYRWKSKDQTKFAHAFIDAGADLVIGHGTHMFQEFEMYKNKTIIYSIGNFVFNSPGRYQKKNIHHYSLAAKMDLSKYESHITYKIKLYPLVSNNELTHFQPRLVNASEMDSVDQIIKTIHISKKDLKRGLDKLGHFIELSSVNEP
ncbi:MAG: CapA family protein [Cytophagales bacterium]